MLFAETRHQIGHRPDAHLFERSVEEHRAIEARSMVTHLRHDIGVTQHHQRGVGFRAAGEAARMAGTF